MHADFILSSSYVNKVHSSEPLSFVLVRHQIQVSGHCCSTSRDALISTKPNEMTRLLCKGARQVHVRATAERSSRILADEIPRSALHSAPSNAGYSSIGPGNRSPVLRDSICATRHIVMTFAKSVKDGPGVLGCNRSVEVQEILCALLMVQSGRHENLVHAVYDSGWRGWASECRTV